MSDTVSLPAFKGSIIRVSILNAGSLVMPSSVMVRPQMPGHDIIEAPIYSFLVENERKGKKLLFDLGLMKAWEEKLPQMASIVQSTGATINITADVPDILNAASMPLSSIDFTIWSHHHPDHTGDLTLFPTSTTLVVGPGLKSRSLDNPGQFPGPNAETLHEAFEGREVIELDFSSSESKVAGLRAIDWFDDGSFYLLEAPGHTSNHIMALARTSADKFVLLAADGAHHCGEFRPTPLVPLPDAISPSPLDPPTPVFESVCPCALFERVHPDPGSFRTTPFYEAAASMVDDPVAHRTTLDAIKTLDASPDVLVILTHDASLLDVLGLFPTADLTGWEKRPSKKDIGQWRFLKDFLKDSTLGEDLKGAVTT